MTSTKCNICDEPFNLSTRRQIICPHDICKQIACRGCYETFLCQDHITVPKCMHCNTEFTHSQIQKIGLTKSFLKTDFAKHQQNVLFAQEQAMLPAAQSAVARDRLIKEVDNKIKSIETQIRELTKEKHQLLTTKRNLQESEPEPSSGEQHFVHRCSHKECNGFVSSAWKCATCDQYTCSNCMEPKTCRDDADHVCNAETVASIAFLKTTTKPCPNCKVLVHKTEGCDQMFCTQCKKLWSWKTGKFETRGHNPHYLQWMREMNPHGIPREPGDVLCGREITGPFLTELHRQIKTYCLQNSVNNRSCFETIFMWLSSVPHLRFHELERFNIDRNRLNLNARKAYVSNSITLQKFKQISLRNYTHALKNENITQILQAVIQSTTDIAFRFQHELQTNPSIQLNNFALEIFNLKNYANQELLAIYVEYSTLQRFFFTNNQFTLQKCKIPITCNFEEHMTRSSHQHHHFR